MVYKIFFNFCLKILKDIVAIAFLKNYKILKNPKFNSKPFKKLIISRSIIDDFDRKEIIKIDTF